MDAHVGGWLLLMYILTCSYRATMSDPAETHLQQCSTGNTILWTGVEPYQTHCFARSCGLLYPCTSVWWVAGFSSLWPPRMQGCTHASTIVMRPCGVHKAGSADKRLPTVLTGYLAAAVAADHQDT